MLTFFLALAALLYSSVGHGGGSGYIAVLALYGLNPAIIKPTALMLNIAVASVATLQFSRAGYFSWRMFWPFAVTSVPMAFVGGRLGAEGSAYKYVLAVLLLLAAVRLFLPLKTSDQPKRKVKPAPAMLLGGIIGLLSGFTGIGGGVYLTPLLLFLGWAGAKRAAGVSAAFILVNSVAGLLGHWQGLAKLPESMPLWILAVLVGGAAGSTLGSHRFGHAVLRRVLGVVLLVASGKLVLA